jgi:hypothetical protein
MKKPFQYLLLFALSGCVLDTVPERNGQFIADYSDFKKIDYKAETWVYRHPTKHVADYSALIIGTISVYPNPEKKIKRATREEFDDFGERMRMEMVQRSRKRYKIVSAAGPGVLKVDFAIIDIKPFVWLTKPDGTRYFRTDTVLKGSKFEVDCKDSVTGERVFALSTLYGGDDYLAYKDPSLLNNVEQAFNEWLSFLRQRMDEIDSPAKK